MTQQSYVQAPITAQGDGTALTASTTATSLLASQAKITLPPNFISYIGQAFRVRAAGRVSNIVTTPGTLTLDIRFGVAGAVVVANGGAMQLNAVAKTNVPWFLDWLLTARAIGSAANFMHQGTWVSESVVGSGLPSATGAGMAMLPNATPAVGTNFDSTAAQIVDLYGTWSLNNANSVQVHQFSIESLN